MSNAILVDTTKCIGCRSCQVSCKQSNMLPSEETHLEGRNSRLQNPPVLSAKTFTIVTNYEVDDPKAPGGLKWVFAKRQCMHCNDPACASACPVTALHKQKNGAVTYDSAKCMGCRYCVWACPFGIPTAEWDSLAPRIRKCDMCFHRMVDAAVPAELNGTPLSAETKQLMVNSQQTPACVKACTTGALKFGDRDSLISEAWGRIKASPQNYQPHIYGEKEAGGTGYMYLSSVPFEKIGFRTDLGERSYPSYSATIMKSVAPGSIVLGALLAGIYTVIRRRTEVAANGSKQEKKE